MNVTEQSTAPADALEPQVGAPLHPHAGGDQAGEPVHLPQRLLACGRLDPSRATAAALRGNELSSALRICRAKLAPHGVRIEVLARRASGALVYVYRPTLLTRCIQEERVAAFLRAEGYDPASLSACIEKLHRRICGTDLQSQMTGRCSFPHEIGFFLGYLYVYLFTRESATRRAASAATRTAPPSTSVLFGEGVPIECLAAVDEDFPAIEAFRAAG